MKRIIYIFFTVISLYGCLERNEHDADQVEVIKINPNEAKEEINLSEFVDSVKYIRLQTDSGCLLGRVHTIYIREHYIYALDLTQQAIFVFDKKGHFISKLSKKGRGPGEYLQLGPAIVPDNEKYIELIDYADHKKLTYSNPSFKLLEEHPMPRISANTCRKTDSIYYFATQQIENVVDGKPTNAAILMVKNGEIEKTLFDKNIITHNSAFSPNIESFTKNDQDELFVSIMYDNTFYQLHNMNAYPIFYIDFGKYGIDNSIGEESLEKQLKYIEATTGLASFPVLNLNNTNIMAFSYHLRQDMDSRLYVNADFHQYIRLKNRNKVFHTKKIRNDITGFPGQVYLSSFYRGIAHEVWHKDYLVDIVMPGQYFPDGVNRKMVEGLGEVEVDDNPIIVLMKLK